MAKQKNPPPVAEELTGESKATSKPTKVRLCDLDLSPSIYSHRDPQVYNYQAVDGNASRKMVESLVVNGQKTPIAYCMQNGNKVLLCGRRRVEACRTAIALQYDPARFFPEMELAAIEVESSDHRDLLEWSITENEARLGFSDEEKLVAAGKMLEMGFSASRAARALDMSLTHFARYQRRLDSAVMREHIAKDNISATDADSLLEAAASHNRSKDLERDFSEVVAKVEHHIALLRADAARRQDKFDEEKLGKVRRYIKGVHVKQWAKDLKEGRTIDWEPEEGQSGWSYECKFDPKEGKITIGALKADMHRMPREDLGQLSYKLSSVARYVEGFFRKKQAEQAIWREQDRDDEDMVKYYKRLGAADLADDLQRKVDLARGEADPTHGEVEPRQERAIADTIQVPPTETLAPAQPQGPDDLPVSQKRKGRSTL